MTFSYSLIFYYCLDFIYEYNPFISLPIKQYFINSTNAELSNEYCFHINTTQQLTQYHDERWLKNGKYIMINSDNHPKYNSTVLIKQNGELLFTIEISNVSADDLGDYLGIIYGNIYDLTLWCREYMYSFFFPSIWRIIYYRQIPTTVSFSLLEIYSKCMHA